MRKSVKLISVNIALLALLLQVAGILISYHHFAVMRERFVNKGKGRKAILFEKLFLGWYVENRPLPQNFIVKDDDVTLYWNKPGQYTMSIFDRDYTIETDSLGIRKGNRKQTNTGTPVMVLGDSHAWGMGVDDDQTFTYILNQSSDYDFTSISCSSFGTPREFLKASQMIRKGIVEKPSVLVIQYCSNDRKENQIFVRNGLQYRPSLYEKPAAPSFSWGKVYQAMPLIFRPSEWPNDFLLEVLGLFNGKVDFATDEQSPLSESHLSLICGHFLAQEEFSNVEKVILTMVSPPKHEKEELFRSNEKMMTDCADHLRRTFGKEVEFLRQGDYDKIGDEYFEIDEHLNETGHKRFAAMIMRSLDKGGTR